MLKQSSGFDDKIFLFLSKTLKLPIPRMIIPGFTSTIIPPLPRQGYAHEKHAHQYFVHPKITTNLPLSIQPLLKRKKQSETIPPPKILKNLNVDQLILLSSHYTSTQLFSLCNLRFLDPDGTNGTDINTVSNKSTDPDGTGTDINTVSVPIEYYNLLLAHLLKEYPYNTATIQFVFKEPNLFPVVLQMINDSTVRGDTITAELCVRYSFSIQDVYGARDNLKLLENMLHGSTTGTAESKGTTQGTETAPATTSTHSTHRHSLDRLYSHLFDGYVMIQDHTNAFELLQTFSTKKIIVQPITFARLVQLLVAATFKTEQKELQTMKKIVANKKKKGESIPEPSNRLMNRNRIVKILKEYVFTLPLEEVKRIQMILNPVISRKLLVGDFGVAKGIKDFMDMCKVDLDPQVLEAFVELGLEEKSVDSVSQVHDVSGGGRGREKTTTKEK